MNAVGGKRERDVHAVVDDETHAQRARNAQGFFRFQIKFARREMLLAQLNKLCSARAQASDLLRMREAGEPGVRNRVEFRQVDSQVESKYIRQSAALAAT